MSFIYCDTAPMCHRARLPYSVSFEHANKSCTVQTCIRAPLASASLILLQLLRVPQASKSPPPSHNGCLHTTNAALVIPIHSLWKVSASPKLCLYLCVCVCRSLCCSAGLQLGQVYAHRGHWGGLRKLCKQHPEPVEAAQRPGV